MTLSSRKREREASVGTLSEQGHGYVRAGCGGVGRRMRSRRGCLLHVRHPGVLRVVATVPTVPICNQCVPWGRYLRRKVIRLHNHHVRAFQPFPPMALGAETKSRSASLTSIHYNNCAVFRGQHNTLPYQAEWRRSGMAPELAKPKTSSMHASLGLS